MQNFGQKKMFFTAQNYFCHHHKFLPDPHSREDLEALSMEISAYENVYFNF